MMYMYLSFNLFHVSTYMCVYTRRYQWLYTNELHSKKPQAIHILCHYGTNCVQGHRVFHGKYIISIATSYSTKFWSGFDTYVLVYR